MILNLTNLQFEDDPDTDGVQIIDEFPLQVGKFQSCSNIHNINKKIKCYFWCNIASVLYTFHILKSLCIVMLVQQNGIISIMYGCLFINHLYNIRTPKREF